MRQIRENKSKVNHETYKSIYRQITRRIETHGKLGALDLVAKIPHYVNGRPIYDVSHATRYVVEKLRIAGFVVIAMVDDSGDYFANISWKSVPKQRRLPVPPPPQPTSKPHNVMNAPADTARRLDFLRMKLKNLS